MSDTKMVCPQVPGRHGAWLHVGLHGEFSPPLHLVRGYAPSPVLVQYERPPLWEMYSDRHLPVFGVWLSGDVCW